MRGLPFVVPGGISVRMSDIPLPHVSSEIAAAADAQPRRHSVPDDGSLRFTWEARPPRLVLAGDIDLNSHTALIAALTLATAAGGTGQVHIDMAQVQFCDVAGLRIILGGGDGQQPAAGQARLHNLPPHVHKLLNLLAGDSAPALASGHAGTSTGPPGQAARPRNDGSAPAPPSTLREPAHRRRLRHKLGPDVSRASSRSRDQLYPAATARIPVSHWAARGAAGVPVPDGTFPVEIIQGVPVVAAPAEIDITSAETLRAALLTAAASGHGTLVVDMTRTRFCDPAGLHTLIAAHKRARAERGQLRLVIPRAPVLRVFALTGVDRVIPNFTTGAEALAPPPATANSRRHPRPQGVARAEDQPV